MRIYVGNLGYDATEAKLEEWLAQWKVTTLSCAIARNSEKQALGFAFVRVGDMDLEKILKLNGKYFGGRCLKVKKEGDRSKQGKRRKL